MYIRLNPDRTKVLAGLERFNCAIPKFVVWDYWPIRESAKVLIWVSMEAYNQDMAEISQLLGKELEGHPYKLT